MEKVENTPILCENEDWNKEAVFIVTQDIQVCWYDWAKKSFSDDEKLIEENSNAQYDGFKVIVHGRKNWNLKLHSEPLFISTIQDDLKALGSLKNLDVVNEGSPQEQEKEEETKQNEFSEIDRLKAQLKVEEEKIQQYEKQIGIQKEQINYFVEYFEASTDPKSISTSEVHKLYWELMEDKELNFKANKKLMLGRSLDGLFRYEKTAIVGFCGSNNG
jgi:hypothetical protein